MKDGGYFTNNEIECKCGCGATITAFGFRDKINTVRGIVGHPIRANSWCRCAIHNLSVGGSSTSSHLKGLATDLSTPTRYLADKILTYSNTTKIKLTGRKQDTIFKVFGWSGKINSQAFKV